MTKHSSFNVLILTRVKKNLKLKKEGLYARITIDGERIELSLGKSITEGIFNKKAQICLGKTKEAKFINEFLTIIISDLQQIRKDILLEGKTLSNSIVKARFKGKPDPDENTIPTLLELYEEHNRRFKELAGTKNHTESTYKRHITSKSHVHDFIITTFSTEDVALNAVGYKFLNDYEHYLKTVRNCNHNSTMKYIKNLGKIIRIAIGEGYISLNPFNKFKLTYEQVDRIRLTKKEVNKIVKTKIDSERLDKVRDLFLFCTHTGLAFCDIHNLKMKNIVKDTHGNKWIKNKRIKTSVNYMVPLLKVPKKIIKKYKHHPSRIKEGIVIPQISNQNYNAYLKELAVICKIDKNLTSHIARHTFATTITLEEGVNIEIISKMLGHTNIKTTQIYAKVQEKAILKGMEELLG